MVNKSHSFIFTIALGLVLILIMGQAFILTGSTDNKTPSTGSFFVIGDNSIQQKTFFIADKAVPEKNELKEIWSKTEKLRKWRLYDSLRKEQLENEENELKHSTKNTRSINKNTIFPKARLTFSGSELVRDYPELRNIGFSEFLSDYEKYEMFRDEGIGNIKYIKNHEIYKEIDYEESKDEHDDLKYIQEINDFTKELDENKIEWEIEEQEYRNLDTYWPDMFLGKMVEGYNENVFGDKELRLHWEDERYVD